MPVESAPSCNPSEPANIATSHLALARCRDAFEQTISSAPEGVKYQLNARREAIKAYKYALPPLVGSQNIRDFIACIAQGMLLGAIEDNEGARLLHAARAAHFALRNSPAEKQSTAPQAAA